MLCRVLSSLIGQLLIVLRAAILAPMALSTWAAVRPVELPAGAAAECARSAPDAHAA